MTTSCSFDFILASQTITIGQDKVTAATLTEEISPIGDTVPINKLSLSVLADNALYDQLITAKQVDAYFTADGVKTLMGVYYISDQSMPNGGVCKLELVDIIGKLDTETFMGDYYCTNPGATSDPVGVSYGTYLTDLLGADGYTLDSSLSGTVLGFVSGRTKREALQQFAIATGSVIDPTRGRKIAIRPMPESTAVVITEADKVTGHTLRMDDAVEGVMVTSHKWGYAYDTQSGGRLTKEITATIGWDSTATLLYGVPFELTSVDGYTDYDAYFQQLGYTKGKSTKASITLTAPSKIAFFFGDYDTRSLAGYYYEDTTNDYYTDYTAVNPDSNMALKRVTDAAFAVPGNVAAIANRIYGYYQYRYIAEGTLLPGTVQAGQRVRMTTSRGLLAGYVERVVTDLYGGGLQKVKIRGKLGTGKDPGGLSISPTTMSLDDTTPTGIITVTRAGDGVISAVSSDTEVATVTIGGSVDLPGGYTPLVYIEGDGTQYLDTGFIPDSDTRVVLDGQYLGGSSETYRYILGAMTSAQSNRYSVMYSALSGLYESNMVDSTSVKFSSAIKETARLHIDKNKNVCTINGETVTNADTAFSAPVSLCLFAMHTATGVSRILKHRIWACSVYDNGELVRKLVPCKTATGVAGMYDQVNAVFYTASGSGDYIAGPELATGDNIITVSSTGKGGTAAITVSVAEGTYHLAPADATCRVTCNFTSANFADADWGEIIAACQSGSIPSTWSVGDSNTMTIDGTSYQVDIIGKAHDSYADGSGTAPLTFQLHDIVQTSRFNAKYLSPNHKLWSECGLREDTLPAILAKMPSEVQAAVRAVSKVSMSDWTALNSGKYKASTYSETLFLLSTVELEGDNATYTYPAEGTQYAYYKAGNSKVKKYSGTATAWWTRSATPIASTNWYGAKYVTAAGSTGSSDAANVSHGVVPAWCF